jgi:hypothetical protein
MFGEEEEEGSCHQGRERRTINASGCGVKMSDMFTICGGSVTPEGLRK